MFLTTMVHEFLNAIKNSNHHQNQKQSNQSKPGVLNYKSKNKSRKCKKSLTKLESIICSNDVEKEQLPQISSSKGFFDNNKGKKCKKTALKAVTQTKVKSASWKRSDKSFNSFNTTLTTNKKSKSVRKRPPTWLQFTNNKVKPQEINASAVIYNEQTSVFRPGTLYSDVLFGAGCPNFVKIKNITPRRSNTTAQKKLIKALQKIPPNEYETSSKEEKKLEIKQLSFPSPKNSNNKITSSILTNSNIHSESTKTTTDSLETISNQESSLTTDTTIISTPISPNKAESFNEKPDVILSELNGTSISDNNLEPYCYNLENENSKAVTTTQDKRFLVSSICDLPNWNFMDADVSSNAFPKFLCQFDDENYLKAEKMAWLGLKLALGNNSSSNKYRL